MYSLSLFYFIYVKKKITLKDFDRAHWSPPYHKMLYKCFWSPNIFHSTGCLLYLFPISSESAKIRVVRLCYGHCFKRILLKDDCTKNFLYLWSKCACVLNKLLIFHYLRHWILTGFHGSKPYIFTAWLNPTSADLNCR